MKLYDLKKQVETGMITSKEEWEKARKPCSYISLFLDSSSRDYIDDIRLSGGELSFYIGFILFLIIMMIKQ